jgi:hypothetical protein
MQNSSQPLNNSVVTDIKHYQINITTTIKIKGRNLPQNLHKKPRKERRKTKG